MTTLIKGVTIELGGQEFVMPPLCLDDAQRLLPKVQEVMKFLQAGNFPDAETFATVVDVVGSALRRNYPDTTDEQLRKILDLGNFRRALTTAMAITGFVRSSPGEAERGNDSTGTPSTPSS